MVTMTHEEITAIKKLISESKMFAQENGISLSEFLLARILLRQEELLVVIQKIN